MRNDLDHILWKTRKYHQQIINNRSIFISVISPSPYTRKIWNFSRSETVLINRSIESFVSSKNVHEQVELFNKTLLNIFHNFIPIKIIVYDDRDPPWMNDEIKKMIKRKNWLFQSQRKSCKLDFAVLNSLTQDISDAITSFKLNIMKAFRINLTIPIQPQKPIGKY